MLIWVSSAPYFHPLVETLFLLNIILWWVQTNEVTAQCPSLELTAVEVYFDEHIVYIVIQYIVTEKEVEKIFFIILILSLFLALTLGLPQSFTLHTYTQYIYTNHRVRNSSFFLLKQQTWAGVENCISTICSKTIKFKSILTDVLAKVTLYSFNLFPYQLGNPALPRSFIVTPAVYPRLVANFDSAYFSI